MIKNSSTIPYKCTVIQLSMSEQGKGIKVLHHTFDQKNGIGNCLLYPYNIKII